MDDFRVGSVPRYEPYADGKSSGPFGKKRERKHKETEQPEESDGFSLEAAESVDPDPQDFYTPSGSDEDES